MTRRPTLARVEVEDRPPVLVYVCADGWSVRYRTGSRTADVHDRAGRAVGIVQVRPWDWTRLPADQDPWEVGAEQLGAALEAFRSDEGACYSDHDEDIRTKGACDYCRGTEPEGQP